MIDYINIVISILNAGISMEEEEELMETVSGNTGTRETAGGGNMNLLWAGVLFLAGMLTALLGVWLRKALIKEKADPSQGEISRGMPAPGEVFPKEFIPEIGKLHAVGGRKNQQDSFSVSEEELVDTYGLLAVVADGMGGLADGDQMSQCAITAIMETFYQIQGDPDRVLLTLVESAAQAVNRKLGEERYNTSGSTLVAGLIQQGAFHYISIGDSRICLYRDHVLYQLNREHVFRHDLEVQAINHEISWERADSHPKAHGLVSFLGMGDLKYVDIPAEAVEIRAGDKFILMSDGVYNALSKEEMAAELERPAQEAADALGKLIEEKQLGGQDNYTAIILGC